MPQIGYESILDMQPLLDAIKVDFNKDKSIPPVKLGNKIKDGMEAAEAACLAGINTTKSAYEGKTQNESHPFHKSIITWESPAFHIVERDGKLVMQGMCQFTIVKP